MKFKAVIISRCPEFVQRAAQMLQQTLDVETIYVGPAEKTVELMCHHQPSLMLLDIRDTSGDTAQLATTIWSIEPNTRILFYVPAADAAQVAMLQRQLSGNHSAGFVLNHPDSFPKLKLAIQAICIFANNYCDPALRALSDEENTPEEEPYTEKPVMLNVQPVGNQVVFLTAAERETLGDLLIGLTDKAIAQKRNLSVRGVQSRLDRLARKLCRSERQRGRAASGVESYNLRARMIFQAMIRGIFSVEDLIQMESAS
jgi:DNA-binding NarL/FixJ family response regulator